MKLITVATDSQGYFPLLQQGSQRFGFDLVALGWGQPWRGFSWRWNVLETYLRTLPSEEIVVWTDAYDVVPVADASTVRQRFNSFGTPLVFSVETEDIPMVSAYARQRIFGECQRSLHLNGGLYMGKVYALLLMIKNLRETFGFKDGDDDQRLLNASCSLPYFADLASVDSQSLIFSNAYTPLTLTGDAPIMWTRDTCFVHGHSNQDLGPVLTTYGYPPLPQKTRRSSLLYKFNQIRHFTQFFTFEIACFVCVCLMVGLYLHRKKILGS